MEPEFVLMYSQELATGQVNQVHIHSVHMILFNIMILGSEL